MEKVISAEERIRRAEEIYNRRRMQNGVRVSTSNVNSKTKVEYSLFKKMILQILICLLIYFSFYLIKNSNYIFSEEIINKTKNFLSYDINLNSVYAKLEEYYNNNLKAFIEKQEDQDIVEENSSIQTNEILENETPTSEILVDENNVEQTGIGGGEEGTELLENEILETSADEEQTQNLSQMEIDANEIKSKYSFILPLKGVVSSRFGPRTPTEIVSANHAGIDIASDEGTIFVAAMDGTVTFVSSEGGYGNHIYIEKDDVITLYAHCKTIYLKEGDIVSQGQQIGEVGSTGNATGPHLHFEIRKSNRLVNPEYILTF